MNWDLFDFVAAGTLLIGAGLMYALLATTVNTGYRPAVAVAIVALLVVVWAELAVGVFGTPLSGQ